ncbi:MAG TPA: hypothetical protein VFU81_14015, partial [Thermomicrobiales bacterium]|nr:hypothetical protein [Thermomicrobiales bacterium]
MDDQQFDRLTRLSAAAVNRRRIVRSLAAGALAEVGLAGLANRVEAKSKSKAADPGVRFFEQLAAELAQETGDCDALKQAMDAFQTAHMDEFNKIKAQEARWDAKKRAQVAKKFEARITQATETLHTLAASCRFRGTSEATICRAVDSEPSADKFPPVGETQCGAGCDCNCICPISGWDCAGAFFGCVGGSEASCCWFGACAGN